MDNPSITDTPSQLRLGVTFEVWSRTPGETVWRRWSSSITTVEGAFDYIARERGRFPPDTQWKVYRCIRTQEREEVSRWSYTH